MSDNEKKSEGRNRALDIMATVIGAAIIGVFVAFMSLRDGTIRRDERIATVEKEVAALKSDTKDIPQQLTGLRKDLENMQATLVEIKTELAAKRR